MPTKFVDFLRLFLPLNMKQKEAVSSFSGILESEDIRTVRRLLKQRKAAVIAATLNTSAKIANPGMFYTLQANVSDDEIVKYFEKLNNMIISKKSMSAYAEFSKKAAEVIPTFIGPNLQGFDMVKKAAALQLFATEPVHMLLLGDPGTGKTDILTSAAALHKISSFGLGSGISGVGLSVTIRGNEVLKGLLPSADLGVCAIDELNLLEERDRASLYNAMEKGFVSYDKGGAHYRFDARVRVIATANPKGDKFSGWTVETLKRQLPFDPALLSRFHLVFMVRRAGLKRFVEISKKIVSGEKRQPKKDDIEFIRGYVSYAEPLNVEIPENLRQQIVDSVAEIKKNEDKFLIEISPRVVVGFVRLAKASARMHLRKKVSQEDINYVKEIIAEGLKLDSR